MTDLSDRAIRRLREVAAWPELEGDRYGLVSELGRGGMGTVYLARDERLGRDVAIKVSHAVIADGELEARLTSEARVLASLEHPGIVPIHDAGRLADGRFFYVMKRVEGESLARHALALTDPTERLRLFERLCEPVAFAHARGVIHRDLKPGNVMVGAFGEVMVMDWGIARRVARAPAAIASNEAAAVARMAETAPAGTRGYMAPEQSSGGPADRPADVYALGGILFYLLTGSHPPPTPAEAHAAIDRAREVPSPLRSIVRRAMALLPAERYEGPGSLADDLRRFQDGRRVLAHRERPWERAARLVRRHRVAVLLIVGYLVMRALAHWWISTRPA